MQDNRNVAWPLPWSVFPPVLFSAAACLSKSPACSRSSACLPACQPALSPPQATPTRINFAHAPRQPVHQPPSPFCIPPLLPSPVTFSSTLSWFPHSLSDHFPRSSLLPQIPCTTTFIVVYARETKNRAVIKESINILIIKESHCLDSAIHVGLAPPYLLLHSTAHTLDQWVQPPSEVKEWSEKEKSKNKKTYLLAPAVRKKDHKNQKDLTVRRCYQRWSRIALSSPAGSAS